MAFARKDRQRLIDDYLAQTGRNMFVAGEFVDWLADRPDHEAYPLIYGADDEKAAREYRIGLARRMASGLRIVATFSTPPGKGGVVRVASREYPALISAMAGRKAGGGYEPFDPESPEAKAELMRQGAQALRSWLARYRSISEDMGIDLTAIEEIVAALSGDVAAAA